MVNVVTNNNGQPYTSNGRVLAINASLGDDWGESLQGNLVIDNTFVCAPEKCRSNQRIYTVSMPNVTEACLYCAFYGCNNLTEVSGFENLTNIGPYGIQGAFQSCQNLEEIPDFTNLISIDINGFSTCFYGCEKITTIPAFTNLTTAKKSSFSSSFHGCVALASVVFPSLYNIQFENVFASCFSNCVNLRNIYFPALKTTSFGAYNNQFNSMISGVTGCTVHFPSNIQSIIGNWPHVLSGFGGTNTTVLFDLTATE